RHVWMRDLRCRLSSLLGANRFTRTVRKGIVKSGIGRPVVHLVTRMSTEVGEVEPMRADTRDFLRSTFARENQQLADLLSFDLSQWK
ncbi:MAG: hypothetical protein AAF497_28615, partial [Planctomycetota bacterium]